MRQRRQRKCAGRADPFGLLVVIVTFALLVTVGAQMTLTWRADPAQAGTLACTTPCVTAGLSY